MKKDNILLLILALIQFTHIMDFMVIMPLGDTLMSTFNITPGQFSLIVSSYSISAGLSAFLAAFYIDRFDRKRALFSAYGGFLLGTLGCALAPDYEFLVAARIITGFFGGIQSGLVLSIIGDVFPYERRGRAMGAVMAAFSVAAVAGVPLGYFLALKFDWNAPFFMICGIGSVVILLVGLYVPSLRHHLQEQYSSSANLAFIKSVGRNRNLITALLFTTLLILGHFTVIPFIAPFMERNVGFEEMEITYIYLSGGAFTIFTSPLIGRLSDKIGKKNTFTIFAVLSMCTIIFITNMGSVSMAFALVVTTIFFIVSSGRMIPATTMVTSVVPPANRGSFMSLNTAVQQLAAGLASALAGLIVYEGPDGMLENYDLVGYLAASVSIFGLIVGRLLKEQN